MDKKHTVKKPTWKGRKNKTRQDLQPRDQRERVQNWERVLNFSQKHKPKNREDWLKLRQT